MSDFALIYVHSNFSNRYDSCLIDDFIIYEKSCFVKSAEVKDEETFADTQAYLFGLLLHLNNTAL